MRWGNHAGTSGGKAIPSTYGEREKMSSPCATHRLAAVRSSRSNGVLRIPLTRSGERRPLRHLDGDSTGEDYERVYEAKDPAVVEHRAGGGSAILSYLYDPQATAPVRRVSEVGISQSGRLLRPFSSIRTSTPMTRRREDGVIAHGAGAGEGRFQSVDSRTAFK